MTVKFCPVCSAPRHPVFHQADCGATYGPELFFALVREAIQEDRRVRARFFVWKALRLYSENRAIGALADEVKGVFPGELS